MSYQMFALLTSEEIFKWVAHNLFLFLFRFVDGLIEVFFGGKHYEPTFRTVNENPPLVNFVSVASDDSSRIVLLQLQQGR